MPEPDMSVWTGRVDMADGPRALRWHQMVKPLTPRCRPGLVLIGFACDEGVRRNGGRIGARDGPRAIRAALANLAWHQECPVYDAGDVRCDDGDMERAQSRLAEVVATAITAGHRPLVLGGGHETAWGTFQGITAAKPKAAVGVINIDAHFDLRADNPGNSGTPFYQIAKWYEKHGQPFRYLCLGVAEPSNTSAIFDRALQLGVDWVTDRNCHYLLSDAVLKRILAFLQTADLLHVSIDLDVLPGKTMPAVSAPAARGVPLEYLESLLELVLHNGRVASVELVELNPLHDIDGQGARVAAWLANHVALQFH
jgi:formiminoglutamase